MAHGPGFIGRVCTFVDELSYDRQIMNGPIPIPPELFAQLEPFDSLLARMIHPDPEARPSAELILDELRRRGSRFSRRLVIVAAAGLCCSLLAGAAAIAWARSRPAQPVASDALETPKPEVPIPGPKAESEIRIGEIRLPAALRHYVDDVVPVTTGGEGPFATAVRIRDQAAVSIIPVTGGCWVVDQAPVKIGPYMNQFLKSGRPFLAQAAREFGPLPAEVRAFQGYHANPLRGTVPVSGGDPERWATIVADGPFMHDPAPPPHFASYVGVAPPSLLDSIPIAVDLDDLPGKSTHCLPVIGISYVEAVAYAAWINDGIARPARWMLWDRRLADLLVGTRAPGAPVSHLLPAHAAPGPYRISPPDAGNVLEFGPFDRDARLASALGSAFSGRKSTYERPITLAPFDRPLDVSFRLALFLENR